MYVTIGDSKKSTDVFDVYFIITNSTISFSRKMKLSIFVEYTMLTLQFLSKILKKKLLFLWGFDRETKKVTKIILPM